MKIALAPVPRSVDDLQQFLGWVPGSDRPVGTPRLLAEEGQRRRGGTAVSCNDTPVRLADQPFGCGSGFALGFASGFALGGCAGFWG